MKIKKNKNLEVIRNFNYCPKYLIIIIRKIGDNNIEFEYNEKINISSYTTSINNHKDFCEYELVSIIENYLITFCKSSEDNQWYKYDGKYDRDPSKINFKKNVNSAPQLLIYKRLKNNM